MKAQVLLAVLLYVVVAVHTQQYYESEFKALTDLFSTTDGFDWKNNTNWLTNKLYCGWYGVTCNFNYHVTALTLPSNGLNGILPTTLGNLTYLNSIDLSKNKLTGPIPDTLAVTSLTTITLVGNSFTSIPDTFSKLQSLRELFLSDNLISGNFPDVLTQLRSLNLLNLSNNKLQGDLPLSLSDLYVKYNLRSLFLSGNGFKSIPADLPMPAPFLAACDLSANNFRCSIPKWTERLCSATCR